MTLKVKSLSDTVGYMESSDYKDRFIAEYLQTKYRHQKLHQMIIKHEAGTLPFEPKCSIDMLKDQATYMSKYLYILEVRAEIEGIDIYGKY